MCPRETGEHVVFLQEYGFKKVEESEKVLEFTYDEGEGYVAKLKGSFLILGHTIASRPSYKKNPDNFDPREYDLCLRQLDDVEHCELTLDIIRETMGLKEWTDSSSEDEVETPVASDEARDWGVVSDDEL